MRPTVYELIGIRIQELRKAVAMTQNELAERSEIGVSYLEKVEGGRRKATIEVLLRIARALEVPLWRLFNDGLRLTPQELSWHGQAKRLAEALVQLDASHVQSLATLARQIAALRREALEEKASAWKAKRRRPVGRKSTK